MPVQPFPINGFIYNIAGKKLGSARVIIYNLKTGSSLETETDSAGLFFIDLASYPSFSYENQDPGIIKSFKEGQFYQSGEAQIIFDTGIGEITQDIQLSGQLPEQQKSIDNSRIDIIEHDPVEDAKKVVLADDILRRYKPADDDNNSNPEYYGFTDRHGNWYIERFNSDDGSHRYTRGTREYVSNWEIRASLTYDFFHNSF